jgi:hypothetical protein
MQALFGGSVDFLHAGGWLVTALAHPITLALFTAAALTVPGAIATEIERGTSDFVLSRPIRRRSYVLAVTTASLILVTAAHLAALLAALLARQTISGVNDLSISGLLRVVFGSWTLFAAVSLVAVLISANASLRSRAVGLCVGFVVLSFLINVAALMLDQLYALRHLSLFHYFQAGSPGLHFSVARSDRARGNRRDRPDRCRAVVLQARHRSLSSVAHVAKALDGTTHRFPGAVPCELARVCRAGGRPGLRSCPTRQMGQSAWLLSCGRRILYLRRCPARCQSGPWSMPQGGIR